MHQERAVPTYSTNMRLRGPQTSFARRAFEFFKVDPTIGKVTEVWLSHANDAGTEYLSVGTFDHHGKTGGDEIVAANAAVRAVDLALPAPGVDRPEGFGVRLIEFVMSAMESRAAWPRGAIRVDGSAVESRYWRFADSVAAYVPADVLRPPMGIVARGLDQNAIEVASLSGTWDYGFAAERAFSVQDTASLRLPRPTSFHPEFVPFL